MIIKKNYWKSTVNASAVLDPVDRVSEVLFGLIMVLSFTGAISASTDAREDVRELLWAALGCNIAWGLVDAIMYLMNIAIERGHSLKIINQIRTTSEPIERIRILRDEVSPVISGMMSDDELSKFSDRLKQMPEPSKQHLITWRDLVSAFEIFFLVFICTFPVAIPFGIIDDIEFAMRVSNGVALFLLLVGGYLLATYAGLRKVLTAVVYMLIGIVLVAITLLLGG